jgi:type II secretory pathway pseudopilin PulG
MSQEPRRRRTTSSAHGYSLVECVFALGLLTTMGAIGSAYVLAGIDQLRTAAAVRYMSARLQRARMDALGHGVNTAVRFRRAGDTYRFGIYSDGNGDGVRTADIMSGIDPLVGREEQLSDQFAGVEFGAAGDLPPVDGDGTAPGDDPVRLGGADMAVFTPLSTSTPGSLYIRGRRGTQYVIRLFGETAKTRMLEFNTRSRLWEAR